MSETPERTALERLTVNLTPRAGSALATAMATTGDTKTDTVNKALQVYAYLTHLTYQGGDVLVRQSADAPTEILRIL